jgi:RNA-directed DNA polymerase
VPAVPSCLAEPLWDQFRALLPRFDTEFDPAYPLGCHRRRIPDRIIFDKMLAVLVVGCSYVKIADSTCSATTLRRRRDEWIAADVFAALERLVRDAYDRMIGLDLGFTHICARTRNGRFLLKRVTIAKRMRAKLKQLNVELKRRRHLPIPEQGRWLASVVRGHLAYYGVPTNSEAIDAFRTQVTRLWYAALQRRSQRSRLNWQRMRRLVARWLPSAHIQHPWPNVRFDARTQGRSPVR